MSPIAVRALILTATLATAIAYDAVLAGPPPAPAIIGSFLANGAVVGTAKENGVTTAVGYDLVDLPLTFNAAHGAQVDTYVGTWKSKGKEHYSGNFNTALKSSVAAQYPDCKVTGKLSLKKIEVVGDDLTSKLTEKFSAKKAGFKAKLKSTAQLNGLRN